MGIPRARWRALISYEEPVLLEGEQIQLSIACARLCAVLGSHGVLTLTNLRLLYRPMGLYPTRWVFKRHAATIQVAEIERLHLLEWYQRVRGNLVLDVWRLRLKNGSTYDFQAKRFDEIAASVSWPQDSWFETPKVTQ